MRLSDVCTKIGSGATPRGGKKAYKDSGIPIIRSQNVLDWSFTSNGLAFIDNDQATALANVEVKPHDVLLNITGDSVARACMVPDWCTPARVNQHVSIVRPGSNLDSTFLLCFLQSSKSLLLKLASSGATRNALTKGMIENLDIDLPDIDVQRAIASLIGQIQQKIALNRQANDYLSDLLDLAYQQFFGPNTKREVTTKTLDEVCDTISVKHAFNKDQLIFLNTGDIDKGLFLHSDYSEVAGMPGQAKKSIQRNDILYSEIRPINRHYAFVNFDADDYVVSTKLMVLRAKGIHPRRIYQFLTLKDTVSQLQLEAESRSGTFPQIRFENLTHFEMPLLSDSEEAEYLNIILPIYDMIDANDRESSTLTALRDALLPKLMSGEIDISQIELPMQPNNHLCAG